MKKTSTFHIIVQWYSFYMHRSLFLPLDAVQMRLVASVPKQFCTVDDEKSPSCLSQKTPKKMQIAWNKKAAGLNSNWSQPRCRGPSFYWCDPQKTLREVMMMVMSCCFFRILKAWSFPPKKTSQGVGISLAKKDLIGNKNHGRGFWASTWHGFCELNRGVWGGPIWTELNPENGSSSTDRFWHD